MLTFYANFDSSTKDIAHEILLHIYGLKLVRGANLEELKSYEDKNYFISADDIHTVSSERVPNSNLLIKITNREVSRNISKLDIQNKALVYLNERNFLVPRLICTRNGEHMTFIILKTRKNQEESAHAVRLLTFLSGDVMRDIPLTSELAFQCGEYFAKIDNALKILQVESNSDPPLTRKSPFNLEHFDSLEDYIGAVNDYHLKNFFLDIVRRFKLEIKPKLEKMSRGVIHGDANCDNILVALTDQTRVYDLAGVIDFGDCQHTCHIFELSLLITDFIGKCRLSSPDDSSIHLKQIIQSSIDGYQSIMKLSLDELQSIPLLIGCRLACLYVMSRYELQSDPNNERLHEVAQISDDTLQVLLKHQLLNQQLNNWFA